MGVPQGDAEKGRGGQEERCCAVPYRQKGQRRLQDSQVPRLDEEGVPQGQEDFRRGQGHCQVAQEARGKVYQAREQGAEEGEQAGEEGVAEEGRGEEGEEGGEEGEEGGEEEDRVGDAGPFALLPV